MTFAKLLALIVVLTAMLTAQPALAAGGRSSIALGSVNGVSTAASPHYEDTVTFAVTTNEQTPHVNVQCVQGTTLVYASTRAYWGTNDRSFQLSQALDSNGWGWTGGAATCTASLWKFGNGARMLAQMSFAVEP